MIERGVWARGGDVMGSKVMVAVLASFGFLLLAAQARTADKEDIKEAREAAGEKELPSVKILATGGTIAGAAGGAVRLRLQVGRLQGRGPDQGGAQHRQARAAQRRAGGQHRQPGHERRRLAEAGQAGQRRAGRARDRRRGDHPRHRHHGGDRLLPQPGGQERQAGGAGRLDATGHRHQRRRPRQPVQRRGRRRRSRRPGPRACWWC